MVEACRRREGRIMKIKKIKKKRRVRQKEEANKKGRESRKSISSILKPHLQSTLSASIIIIIFIFTNL